MPCLFQYLFWKILAYVSPFSHTHLLFHYNKMSVRIMNWVVPYFMSSTWTEFSGPLVYRMMPFPLMNSVTFKIWIFIRMAVLADFSRNNLKLMTTPFGTIYLGCSTRTAAFEWRSCFPGTSQKTVLQATVWVTFIACLSCTSQKTLQQAAVWVTFIACFPGTSQKTVLQATVWRL